MDRRGFIRGAFGGVTSAGIILAAPSDAVEAFVSQVRRNDPLAVAIDSPGMKVEPGHWVFDREGNMLGVIESLDAHNTGIDVASLGDPRPQYIPGVSTVKATVVMYGPAYFHNGGVMK